MCWKQITDTLFVWFCFACVKEAMVFKVHSSVPSCRIMVLCNNNETYWQEPTSVGNYKGSSPCFDYFKQWYSNSITYM